jgi:hypothetical protein
MELPRTNREEEGVHKVRREQPKEGFWTRSITYAWIIFADDNAS